MPDPRKPKFTRPKLLQHPPLPDPMHNVNPRTIKKSKWWDGIRQDAYAANNYCCHACGRFRLRLEAHEAYEINHEAGISHYLYTVALCHFCHSFIHSTRLRHITAMGIVPRDFALAVRRHGYTVLLSNNLEPSPWTRINFELTYELPDELLTAEMAPWADWRLEFEGNLYPPYFKTREEHDKHYADLNDKELRRIAEKERAMIA